MYFVFVLYWAISRIWELDSFLCSDVEFDKPIRSEYFRFNVLDIKYFFSNSVVIHARENIIETSSSAGGHDLYIYLYAGHGNY